MRAMLSVALPAACGTIRRSGRSGNCAAEGHAAPMSRRNAKSLRGGAARALPNFVGVGVHAHVEVALLQIFQLLFRELAARRHGVGIAVLVERNDDRPVLPLAPRWMCAIVPCTSRRNAARDRAVLRDAEAARTGARSAHRRNFFGAGKLHADRAAARHPGRNGVAVGLQPVSAVIARAMRTFDIACIGLSSLD